VSNSTRAACEVCGEAPDASRRESERGGIEAQTRATCEVCESHAGRRGRLDVRVLATPLIKSSSSVVVSYFTL
jgi:hypothetical protein